jgi:hypothetical protein
MEDYVVFLLFRVLRGVRHTRECLDLPVGVC